MKGNVESRQRGKAKGDDRIRRLIEEHVTKPAEERAALAKEWIQLRDAGVPFERIAEEYRVSSTTLLEATRDPEEWATRTQGGARVRSGRWANSADGAPKERRGSKKRKR